MSDNEKVLESISAKLNAMLAISLAPDLAAKGTAQKVEFLARLGLANQDIATILGTSKGSVEVLKSRANKKK